MKITIVDSSEYPLDRNGIIWTNNTKCITLKPCKECELYPIVKDNCFPFRKPIINVTHTRTVPYTVYTDDFPKLFI